MNLNACCALGRAWRMRLIYNAASCYVWAQAGLREQLAQNSSVFVARLTLPLGLLPSGGGGREAPLQTFRVRPQPGRQYASARTPKTKLAELLGRPQLLLDSLGSK